MSAPNNMDEHTRKIEFLKRKIASLKNRKHSLLALASFSDDQATREAWATQLDATVERLRKCSGQLADLERELKE